MVQIQVQTSEEELTRLRTVIKDLQTKIDLLKEENHSLRKNDLIGEQLLHTKSLVGHSSNITSITKQFDKV